MRRYVSCAPGWLLAACSLGVVPSVSAAAGQERPTASAASADAVAELRRELAVLRHEYESRIAALEARLATVSPSPAAPPAAETAAPAVGPAPAAAQTSNVFNPDIAAIGNFVGAAGPTPGGGEPSLNMQEAEFSFQAVVDPYARADFFITAGPDEVELEEGYITFPTLPGGLLAKVGKMRDAFGKVNAQHPHTLPFVDRPLVTTNLTGGEEGLADAGISVARLIPNPWLFLEATAQVYQGRSEIFQAPTRGDLALVGHLRAYRDLGESTNIDLGGSVAYGHNGASNSSTTRLLGVDATLRWKPLRRSIYTHVLARGELTWSRREEPGFVVDASGGYGYLEYQFARRFTAGVRYDNSGRAAEPGVRDEGGSFILGFKPSEWSLLRAQYRRTQLGEEKARDELLFQMLFAIGAHAAHPF
jgi:hypothetical protein